MCSPRWTPPICNGSCSCRPAPSMANTGAAGSTRTHRPRRKASTAASCWKPRHCWQPDPNPPRRCDWPACGPGRLQLIGAARGPGRRARRAPHWANRIHIDDAAAAVAHLALLPSVASVYIGCDDTPLPLHELYADLARIIRRARATHRPRARQCGQQNSSNARLRASGLRLQWPDSRPGYARCWPTTDAPESRPRAMPWRARLVLFACTHAWFVPHRIMPRDEPGYWRLVPSRARAMPPPIPSPPSPTPIPIPTMPRWLERPLYRDDTLNLWVASSPQAIAQVLAHPPPASGRPPNPCRAACARPPARCSAALSG